MNPRWFRSGKYNFLLLEIPVPDITLLENIKVNVHD
jgi:hypothetical protein